MSNLCLLLLICSVLTLHAGIFNSRHANSFSCLANTSLKLPNAESNTTHHIYSYTYGGWGLYTDEGSTGIVMENNLVYSCKSSAFHQNYGKDNIIRNNIFYNQIRAQLEASKVEPHVGFQFTNNIVYYSQGNLTGIRWDKTNFLADYNAYWDTRTKDIMVATQTFKEWQNAGKDKHSIIADPSLLMLII